MLKLQYLIVGTGRCGTLSAANFLTQCGITCGHESIFTYHGLEYALNCLHGKIQPNLSFISKLHNYKIDCSAIRAESSYMAAPYLGHPVLAKTKIIHIIRHPDSVINSFLNHFTYFQENKPSNLSRGDGIKYESFIYEHLPMLTQKMSPLERATLYYIEWNNLIENLAPKDKYLRIKVEELYTLKNKLRLQQPRAIYKMNKWEKPTNIIPVIDIRLNEIKEKYGY